jgi:osmotically-inducible protein OsmY
MVLQEYAMSSAIDIEQDVMNELRWAPDLDEKGVTVKVTDDIATLSGRVHSYLERHNAENAAKRVVGIAGVVNDIKVHLAVKDLVPDVQIAREASAAINRELPAACRGIKVSVHQGRITLEGEVEWYFQRNCAEVAMLYLRGVVALSNLLLVRPRSMPIEIKEQIRDAFLRSAVIDANAISIDASGGEVVLRGKVRSWAERDEAQRTAWSAPGVTLVRNEIAVRP